MTWCGGTPTKSQVRRVQEQVPAEPFDPSRTTRRRGFTAKPSPLCPMSPNAALNADARSDKRSTPLTAASQNRTVAHSAPVYVTVPAAKQTWHAPSVPAIVDRREALLRDLVESTPDPFVEDFELGDVKASYVRLWPEVLPKLRIRVDEAFDRYERIGAVASTGG
jgi:hypothetical protein